MAGRKLPNNLKLGVATSAYQIEGAWNSDDKTPSIWDVMCHQPNNIEDNTTGDDACKSYYFYKRDIDMLKFLGVDFYRFSINWTRLFPNGFTNITSSAGLDYYNNLINELLANNIEPVVTMYHWDLPQKLQDLGGWANPLIAYWFEDYARGLYKLFGDRVKTWITINEPHQIAVFGCGMDMLAPRINCHGIGEYLAAKNILMAHARAWHIYDEEFRKSQNGVCGIVIASDFAQGATNNIKDVEASVDAVEFHIGLYSHPIFSSDGDFPERVKRRVAAKSLEQGYPRSRLPEFTNDEIEYLKGTSDFFGFNHYTTYFYTRANYESSIIPSFYDDIGAKIVEMNFEKGVTFQCTIVPKGIRRALNWVKDTCNNPNIMIFENGFDSYGGLNDLNRVSYYRQYFDDILDAIEIDGCNITRYTAWSLMDNFEWASGSRLKFGLFQVDYDDENRKRSPRCSAIWYKQLISTRTLNLNYVPLLEDICF
ncbi:myrosinase 1-like [Zerene cesonia]|uniref:myrosinase 1-like n=1 Tax=Zerene cesonia TaxID=33412 RepID=UPI0018E51C9E|nr:myrosinase 1-like [Zerene cesonia]